MDETSNNGFKLREIDINSILKNILQRKKLFTINILITLAVSSIIIFSIPRSYVCTVKLAPESTSTNVGMLGGLASTLGLNMNSMMNQDAIIPEFYPDVMESVDYVTQMFPVKVTTKDGKISTTYYDYLKNYQKYPWWSMAAGKLRQMFKKKDTEDVNRRGIDPFRLTKQQMDIAESVAGNISGSVDKKTDVITITVTDQDPLVCATIADSAKARLQQFITDYRTAKAKNDLKQAVEFSRTTKQKYQKAQQLYAAYSDANEDVILQSVKSKIDELENEMQLKYTAYQTSVQQVQIAQAKLQERTPAFTTLQSATVPLKPAAPKRIRFIIICLFLVFTATTLYVCRKNN